MVPAIIGCSFGYVRIGFGFLRLEAPSRTRLQTGRGLLESHAGGLLKHLGDSYTGVEEIKSMAMGGTAPSEPTSSIPLEMEREVVLQYKNAHHGKWVDERLPALGGKTPRQAAKTPEGRKTVLELIRTLENMEAHELRTGHPAYDVNILRRDLGLDEA